MDDSTSIGNGPVPAAHRRACTADPGSLSPAPLPRWRANVNAVVNAGCHRSRRNVMEPGDPGD